MVMQKESLRHKVFRDSFWNFLATIISRAGGLIFTIILARYLLPGGFGIYSLSTSVALMFLTFADLGVNQAMIRFVSLNIEKNKKRAAAYFRYILKLKIALSLAVSIILLLISYPLSYYIFNKPESFWPLLFLGFYVFILAIEGFFESLFFINNKVAYITKKEAILQVSRVVIVFFLFYFLTESSYVIGAVLSLILSIIIASIFVIYYSKKYFNFIFGKNEAYVDKRKVIRFVGYLTVGSLSGIFFSYVDTILLGIFVSPSYVGFYKVAFTLVFGIVGFFSFLNVLLPVLTQIKHEKLSEAFNKIMKYSMIISIPAVFGLVSLSNYALRTVYGYEYLPASLPLYFLSPLIVLAVWLGNMQILYSARGIPEKFAKLTFFMTLLNILLNLIFIRTLLNRSEIWGTTGAAIATLISWSIFLIITIFMSKREFKISLRYSYVIKPLVASIIMALFLYLYNSQITDMTLYLGTIEIMLGMIVYFTCLAIIKGIAYDDVKTLIDLVHKKTDKKQVKKDL